MARPDPTPNSTRCKGCGHERHYHQGSGSLTNRKGCGVTHCSCKAFR